MAAIDARGLSCPQPLMMAQAALAKDSGPVVIIVDSESAVESVLRVLAREKREVAVTRSGQETTITAGPKSK
ncbi:MAG: sulfurtransferase TusA family protein [Deltaproteobacteria bacterium]|jgi:TusA-related sulfurtransferase|nr:sulfurtransferase TusA family protein [Deltaproteobacteria bacterium]